MARHLFGKICSRVYIVAASKTLVVQYLATLKFCKTCWPFKHNTPFPAIVLHMVRGAATRIRRLGERCSSPKGSKINKAHIAWLARHGCVQCKHGRAANQARQIDTGLLLAFWCGSVDVSNSLLVLVSKQGEMLALSSCWDHLAVSHISHTKMPYKSDICALKPAGGTERGGSLEFSSFQTVNKGRQKNPIEFITFKETLLSACPWNHVSERVELWHVQDWSIVH